MFFYTISIFILHLSLACQRFHGHFGICNYQLLKHLKIILDYITTWYALQTVSYMQCIIRNYVHKHFVCCYLMKMSRHVFIANLTCALLTVTDSTFIYIVNVLSCLLYPPWIYREQFGFYHMSKQIQNDQFYF